MLKITKRRIKINDITELLWILLVHTSINNVPCIRSQQVKTIKKGKEMSKKLLANVFLLSTLLGSVCDVTADSKTEIVRKNTAAFAPQLQKFDSYLGGWTATFPAQPGQPPVIDVTLFEKVLNGKALKTTHSINEGVYGGESYIFWNNKTNRLEFHYFTTADFFTTGWLEFVSDNEFVAYEDVTGEGVVSQGITKVKSSSKLLGDKMEVSTSYLKNGEWTKPETRTYQRTTRDVIFN